MGEERNRGILQQNSQKEVAEGNSLACSGARSRGLDWCIRAGSEETEKEPEQSHSEAGTDVWS